MLASAQSSRWILSALFFSLSVSPTLFVPTRTTPRFSHKSPFPPPCAYKGSASHHAHTKQFPVIANTHNGRHRTHWRNLWYSPRLNSTISQRQPLVSVTLSKKNWSKHRLKSGYYKSKILTASLGRREIMCRTVWCSCHPSNGSVGC
jgi:hypothetical protein